MNKTMNILSATQLFKSYDKKQGLFNKQSIKLRAVNNVNIDLKFNEFLE